jgi:hypothetical protein
MSFRGSWQGLDAGAAVLAVSYQSVTFSLEIVSPMDVTNDTLLSHRVGDHAADHGVFTPVICR